MWAEDDIDFILTKDVWWSKRGIRNPSRVRSNGRSSFDDANSMAVKEVGRRHGLGLEIQRRLIMCGSRDSCSGCFAGLQNDMS